jgi:hypothetical protein
MRFATAAATPHQAVLAGPTRASNTSTAVPICMYCQRIRDKQNQWLRLERDLASDSPIVFTHGLCPSCLAQAMASLDADRPS